MCVCHKSKNARVGVTLVELACVRVRDINNDTVTWPVELMPPILKPGLVGRCELAYRPIGYPILGQVEVSWKNDVVD